MAGLLVVTPAGPDADSLCANLKEHGFDVFSVTTGAEAVGAAARRRPDVILMDPALSAMDRWHAVKRLNTELATSRIPVLTLGSDANSPAGLQRVLTKIERTIGRLPAMEPKTEPPPRRAALPSPAPVAVAVSREPPPRTPVDTAPPRTESPRITRSTPPRDDPPPARLDVGLPPAATPALPPRRDEQPAARILVVDDNALNRDMLSRRLERRGYAVKVAEDGEQALAIVRNEPIDLVLLDWMMPGLSGIDVLHRLRERFSQVELPVIMATAKTEAEDIVEALKAEANDYVTKPLNFDVVHARLETQLKLARAHKELVLSERRYRALLENTGDMLVQYEPSGKVQYVSPASRALLGFEPEALKKRSFYDWIHPIDRRELEEQQRQRVTLPPAFTFIARMQRQDGAHIWVETSCRVLKEGGAPLVQAACRDVTEHMESLSGDEPPLPLGGDIMAHPGWRGASSRPAPDREMGPPTDEVVSPPQPTPVLVLTALDGLQLDTLGRSDPDLARRIGELVVKALGRRTDGGV